MFELLKMCHLNIWFYIILGMSASATPARRSSFTLDEVTIRTEIVGQNNRQEVLAKFNLTEAMMSRIYAGINAGNKQGETDGRTMQYFNNLRDFR